MIIFTGDQAWLTIPDDPAAGELGAGGPDSAAPAMDGSVPAHTGSSDDD